MFDTIKDLYAKAETKADVSVLLGAGTIGYAVDAIYDPISELAPASVAALLASGGLAIKKGIDAFLEGRRARWREYKVHETRNAAIDRAETLQQFFLDHEYPEGFLRVDTHLEWRRVDIIDDQQLDQACEAVRKGYLAQLDVKRSRLPERPSSS